jgi:hypothetical protein
VSDHRSTTVFPASSNNDVQGAAQRPCMRHFGLALIGLVALAGGALALGVTLNASHSTTLNDSSMTGQASASASDKGASATLGLRSDAATADGAASVTLPDVPQPQLPSMPHVAVGVDGSGNANAGLDAGSGSATVTGGGSGSVSVAVR